MRQRRRRLGLVNRVVPAGQLLAAARELAAQLLPNSPAAYGHQTAAGASRGGRDRPQAGTGHRRKRRHSRDRRFSRRARGVSGKAQAADWSRHEPTMSDVLAKSTRARALRRNRPDGRGLLRELLHLFRDRARGVHARARRGLQGDGGAGRQLYRGGRIALPLSAPGAL